ncbi:MAG: DUF368 domain-containing protein [archaeon]
MKWAVIFMKGLLMGICDIIPGISGGTVAFVTGIYARLIGAVNAISQLLYGLLEFAAGKRTAKQLAADFRKSDPAFLVALGAGISVSIFLGSGIISYLLERHFSYTISFFIGLILASSKLIYDRIENHTPANGLTGLAGFLIGISFSVLIPLNVDPSYLYVFFAGFVAVSAMFLPGISGAFILLILGLYDFMISVLHNILDNIPYLLSFMAGAALGALSISKLISYLFRTRRCKTLYFLLGLVVGALSIPVKRLYVSASWSAGDTGLIALSVLLGISAVILVNRIEKHK